MIEASCRHGHFEGRHPVQPKLVERTWVPESADTDGDQPDWSAFLSRFETVRGNVE
jgi:hypothetical protein